MLHSPLAVTNYFKTINFLLELVRGKKSEQGKTISAQKGRKRNGNKKENRLKSELKNELRS